MCLFLVDPTYIFQICLNRTCGVHEDLDRIIKNCRLYPTE
jgi:hypothetical protein